VTVFALAPGELGNALLFQDTSRLLAGPELLSTRGDRCARRVQGVLGAGRAGHAGLTPPSPYAPDLGKQRLPDWLLIERAVEALARICSVRHGIAELWRAALVPRCC
jgi:hypothetical protein